MKQLEKSVAYFRTGYVPFCEAQLSIASAPILYGLSIYTVFPVFWSQSSRQLYMFRLPDHFKRLQNSARIMAFDDFLSEWDYPRFERTMRDLLKNNATDGDSLVRVGVFVDDMLTGTRMADLKHNLSAFVYPAQQILPAGGAKLCVSSWRRNPDNAIPARAKINGSYVNAALMKHEAVRNGFDDAIALDEQGHVSESTVSNLFMVCKGQLITPNNTTDLLEGITRDTVFKLADHLNIQHVERTIDRSELYIADEVFLCGSSMNITPVLSIDHRKVGTGEPGPITKSVAKLYSHLGHNPKSKFKDWLTKV